MTTISLMIGTALGGLITFEFGYTTALTINIVAFLISGILTLLTTINIDNEKNIKKHDNNSRIKKWYKDQNSKLNRNLLIFLVIKGV